MSREPIRARVCSYPGVVDIIRCVISYKQYSKSMKSLLLKKTIEAFFCCEMKGARTFLVSSLEKIIINSHFNLTVFNCC